MPDSTEPTSPSPASVTTPTELRGVEGWLLVLCGWLAVISPLFSFMSLSANAQTSTEFFWGVVVILITMAVGILLWIEHRHALGIAIYYFYARIAFGWIFATINSSSSQITQAIVSTIFCAAWLGYINTSKRVLNTYVHRLPPSDQRFYDAVAQEIQSGALQPGVWARALADSDGNESRARAKYIRLRVAQMAAEAQSH